MVLGGGTFGRWLGHMSGTLLSGINALVRRETNLRPFLALHHIEIQWEDSHREAGRGSSLDIRPASTLILDFLASKTEKKINICCLNHQVYDSF